jgi:hypothetical protein
MHMVKAPYQLVNFYKTTAFGGDEDKQMFNPGHVKRVLVLLIT